MFYHITNVEDSSLVFNQVNWRRSQISILYIKFPGFFFFFTGKQYMKTPMKVSIKLQRIVGTLSRMHCRMSIPFKFIFSGEDYFWFLLQKDNIMFVLFIHIYRKYHISMHFLRRIIFQFPSKEKQFSEKKQHLSR